MDTQEEILDPIEKLKMFRRSLQIGWTNGLTLVKDGITIMQDENGMPVFVSK